MKVSIRAIKLNADGTSDSGVHYGPGPTVYTITVDGKAVGEIRARKHTDTWFQVLQRAKDDVKRGAYGSAYGGVGNPKSHRGLTVGGRKLF